MISAVLDHLWQSTLFALGVGLLTLAFRGNSAGVRYGLWFAASVKFLLPFAVLTAAGRRLIPPSHPVFHVPVQAYAVEDAAQPFSAAMPILVPPAAPRFDPLPALAIIWSVGFAAVMIVWLLRWMRLRAILRRSTALDWPAPTPVKSSPSLIEPGVVGVWRPILLFPESLTTGLEPAQVQAIMAHELCHLRRRDNLTAAIHMLVEALFWFFPPVWWIGARLIEERERACDDAVVQSGHDPEVYAQGILQICRLYLQSPLACVAGVSGAGLKTRVETIMTAPPAMPLDAVKKGVLAAAAIGAVASPVIVGLLSLQSSAPVPHVGAYPVSPAAVIQPAAPTLDQISTGTGLVPQTQGQALALTLDQISTGTGVAPQTQRQALALPTAGEIALRRAEQEAPQQLVPFESAKFDRYVGYYQLGQYVIFKVTREGGKFFTQLTGQGPVEVYPESSTKFFATVVPAQVSFSSDSKGRVSELVLHQNGLEQRARKIDEDVAKNVQAALAQRIKYNVPSAGTEASLRRYFLSIESGRPNYNDMTPALAELAREQWPKTSQSIKILGGLKSIKFLHVNPQGYDVFLVEFDHNTAEAVIAPLNADGKVVSRGWRKFF